MRAAFTSQALSKAAKGEEERRRAEELQRKEQLRTLRKQLTSAKTKTKPSKSSGHRKKRHSQSDTSSNDPDGDISQRGKRDNAPHGKKRLKHDLKTDIESYRKEDKDDARNSENASHEQKRLKRDLKTEIESYRKEQKDFGGESETDAESSTSKTKTDARPETDKHERINGLFLRSRKTVTIRTLGTSPDKEESVQSSAGSEEHPAEARIDVRDEVASDFPGQKPEEKSTTAEADTQSKPQTEQNQMKHMFVENIQPSDQELNLRYAKLMDSEEAPRKPGESPQPTNKQLKVPSRATTGETYRPTRTVTVRCSGDVRKAEIETSKIVSSLRRSRERLEAVPWLMAPAVTAAVVFIIAVFIVCVDLKYLVLLLAIPLLEKFMEEVIERLHRAEYTLMEIEDSEDKDFLRRLVREIETRTTAKTKRKLFNALTVLE